MSILFSLSCATETRRTKSATVKHHETYVHMQCEQLTDGVCEKSKKRKMAAVLNRIIQSFCMVLFGRSIGLTVSVHHNLIRIFLCTRIGFLFIFDDETGCLSIVLYVSWNEPNNLGVKVKRVRDGLSGNESISWPNGRWVRLRRCRRFLR